MACALRKRAAAYVALLASCNACSAAELPAQQSRDHLLLQVNHAGGFKIEHTVLTDGEASQNCCGGCGNSNFCSPQSGNCYDGQHKHYYIGCSSGTPACCGGCSGRSFCSPRSNNCYDGQHKDYYVGCPSADPDDNVEGDDGGHLGGGGGGNTSHDKPAESFTCCNGCSGKPFCSPLSASCYNDQSKPYYMACKEANPLGFNLQTCRGTGDMRVKMLTYNLFWWNLFGQRDGGSAGRLVREAAAGDLFDVVGFQECDDPGWIRGDAGMHGGEYDHVRWGSNTIAFRKTRWEKLADGRDYTSEDRQDQYYGRRGLQWIRLRDTTTGGTLFFAHTHGPLPVNSGGRYGGEATGWAILSIIYRRAQEGDSIVLTGDFNAEHRSSTVQLLEGRIHRVMTDWVDHIFTNCATGVEQTRNLGNGGSDHDALMAVINF